MTRKVIKDTFIDFIHIFLLLCTTAEIHFAHCYLISKDQYFTYVNQTQTFIYCELLPNNQVMPHNLFQLNVWNNNKFPLLKLFLYEPNHFQK